MPVELIERLFWIGLGLLLFAEVSWHWPRREPVVEPADDDHVSDDQVDAAIAEAESQGSASAWWLKGAKGGDS